MEVVGSSRRDLVILLIVNVILRAAWLLVMHPKQDADFEWYFTHAAAMAAGHGYRWSAGTSGPYTAYWPIGWPFILSLLFRITGPNLTAGLILNAVFSVAIVYVIYAFAMQLFANRKAAFISALAYTLLPSQIEWNAVLGSEESFTFLFLLALYLYVGLYKTSFVRSRLGWPVWLGLLVTGIIWGFACDVRPIPLAFVAVMLVYELVVNIAAWRRTLLRIVTFGVGVVAGVAPVTIRNWIAMHHFIVVSTNGGVDLWQGTRINGGYYWSWLPWKNPLLAAGNNEILKNQIGKQWAKNYILHHPETTFVNGLIKIFDLYKVDTNAVWYTVHQVSSSRLLFYGVEMLTTGLYWVFMVLAVAGIVVWIRRIRPSARTEMNPAAVGGRRYTLYPLLFVIYYTLLFMLFPAWDRFRYPLMPLFALFIGLGWMMLFRTKFGRRSDEA
ncbi:hypothetical protein J2S03_001801 [Alicyclobacillus cycloheptanicus]|uniref:Glycosyltransferase RgtA/B/C/D-like domain-containing protein n=1 Tax=Alicyclobacillus cycloheptanicus TaxID=1457 RepID=A0ABT9XHZ1_9BACL|nr:hypothetical protein [Alicyclobacillus cycloheptanicus]